MSEDIHIARREKQVLTPYEEAIKEREYAIKLRRAESEAKSEKRRPIFRKPAVLSGLAILAVSAGIGVGNKLINSPEEPSTISAYPHEVATDTAERALIKIDGIDDPTTQEINQATEIMAEANPEHSYGSGAGIVFETQVPLVVPEDLTPQN